MKNKIAYIAAILFGVSGFGSGYLLAQERERRVAISNIFFSQIDQLNQDAMALTVFKQNCAGRLKWLLESRVQAGVAHVDATAAEREFSGFHKDELRTKLTKAREALLLLDRTGAIADVSQKCK